MNAEELQQYLKDSEVQARYRTRMLIIDAIKDLGSHDLKMILDLIEMALREKERENG